jgi:NAD(P)-dependent dehydrogenase (short-subunit alcohol dehydrogenase family)
VTGVAALKGLRVLVTAGGSGIGRAIADLLIAGGARVHICDAADDWLAAAHPNAGASKGGKSSP